MRHHVRILDYALGCLWRQKWRHTATLTVCTFVVFILASVLLMTGALKHEARMVLAGTPDLIVQRISAGRHVDIPESYGLAIESIRGVRGVSPRWWGYYYDPPPDATYTFIGADAPHLDGSLLLEGNGYVEDEPMACVIGNGVAEARLIEPEDILPVKGADGKLYALRVSDVFTSASELLTHDVILMRTEAYRRIFAIPTGVATDLVVDVPNPEEADTITRKILERLPDVRVIDRERIIGTYDAMFDWRGGLVTLAFAGALAAFGVFAWDRAAGLSIEERKDLGVLKAVGWDVGDVMRLKLCEGVSLSLVAFLTGAVAAHLHVFRFGGSAFAPFLKGWSVLFPDFHLQPHGEPLQLLTVFALTVIPYVFATLAPAWRAATTDPEGVMR